MTQQNVYLPSCGEQFTANLGQVESQGVPNAYVQLALNPLVATKRIRNIEKLNKVGTLGYCPREPLCETVSPKARTPIPCLSISEVLKKRRPAVLAHHRAPDHSQLGADDHG